jgi:WD40 repeat protein
VAFEPHGGRIVSGSDDKTVRVWDAASGACLEVIPGEGDVSAIAAGAVAYPWRAVSRGQETVIERANDGQAVAWFPAALEHIATHPSGRVWAGSVGNHLYLIRLEGAEED